MSHYVLNAAWEREKKAPVVIYGLIMVSRSLTSC